MVNVPLPQDTPRGEGGSFLLTSRQARTRGESTASPHPKRLFQPAAVILRQASTDQLGSIMASTLSRAGCCRTSLCGPAFRPLKDDAKADHARQT